MACSLLKKPSIDLSHSYRASASSSRSLLHSTPPMLFTMSISCSNKSSLKALSDTMAPNSRSFRRSRKGSASFSQVFIRMPMLVRRFFASCFSVGSQRMGLSIFSGAASVAREGLASGRCSEANKSARASRSTTSSPVRKTDSSIPPCPVTRRCHRKLFLTLEVQSSFSHRVGAAAAALLLPFPPPEGGGPLPPALPLPDGAGGPPLYPFSGKGGGAADV
mmetsp:Transcript_85856/g.251362  ORF Transcript_85856/g.251362 Transcript_85856/m.251362 type:complete len:220 (-) Transcript_85856:981-1640(-)